MNILKLFIKYLVIYSLMVVVYTYTQSMLQSFLITFVLVSFYEVIRVFVEVLEERRKNGKVQIK